VTGEDKAEAVEHAFAGPSDPKTPASLIRSEAGKTLVVLDRAAASRLPG
jgi:6-phosphogluconolactonase/glucosamine-6-phosphate isomerase/deaminase